MIKLIFSSISNGSFKAFNNFLPSKRLCSPSLHINKLSFSFKEICPISTETDFLIPKALVKTCFLGCFKDCLYVIIVKSLSLRMHFLVRCIRLHFHRNHS